MTTATFAQAPNNRADRFRPLLHADAPALARTEYERLLKLLEHLEGKDWLQPTYCSEWTVRELAAHLAGAVAGFARWSEFYRQFIRNPYTQDGDEQIDAINRCQVQDRAGCTTDAIIEEFRTAGQRAITVRHRLPWPLRQVPLHIDNNVGKRSVQYLCDVIYPRDQWMHRYDICAATGNEMVVTSEHDGRIVELVMCDVDSVLRRRGLSGRSIEVDLHGTAGGSFTFGSKGSADAVLTLDVHDFALISSGRIAPADAQSRMTIEGDQAVADWFLANCAVPY